MLRDKKHQNDVGSSPDYFLQAKYLDTETRLDPPVIALESRLVKQAENFEPDAAMIDDLDR